MLEPVDRMLRDQMEVVSYRFLHAETYFHKSSGRDETFWKFSQNCFGEVACLLWCHLFNSYYKDPVHYSNLFGNDKLATLSPKFATATVKARILAAASLDEASYATYRDQVKRFRDKHVAHREYLSVSVVFPNLNVALAMIQELRIILEETAREELRCNPQDAELEELVTYYEDHQNEAVVFSCTCNADDAIGSPSP